MASRLFVVLVKLTKSNTSGKTYDDLSGGDFIDNLVDKLSNQSWKIALDQAIKADNVGSNGGDIEIVLSTDKLNQNNISKSSVTTSISQVVSDEFSTQSVPYSKLNDEGKNDVNLFSESVNDGGWLIKFLLGNKDASSIYLNNGIKIEILSDASGKKIKSSTPDSNSIFLLSDGTFTHKSGESNEMVFGSSQVDLDIVNTFVDKLNKAAGTVDTNNVAKLCQPSYQSCSGATYVDPVKVDPPGPTQSATQSGTQSAVQSATQSAPSDGIVPQEVSKGEVTGNTNTSNSDSKTPEGSFPGTKKVDESKVEIPPIKLKTPSNEEDKKQFARGIGYLPFVWYNGYQIDARDIKYFALYHDGIIPKIKITFYDTMNIIESVGFPLDDTKVQIFLNSKSKNLKSIHLEFKIQNFQDNGGRSYTFVGTINLPELYLKKYKSYNNKTSYETIRDVCSELKLGFNSNIDNTNDKMTWINSGKRVHQFLDNIILNSYRSDEAFIIGYIDYYYSFNYVDIEKELGRDVSKDLCIDTSGFSEQQGGDDSERITRMGLSNDLSFKESSMYFSKYKVRNDSTSISLRKGYLTKVKYYDDVKKDFLIFDVDSITSEGDKTIILKGNPTDEKYFKDNYSTVWTGKIDVDNAHSNYNYSVVQNRQNLDDLVKISVDIWLPNSNFNLYKFQKIFMSFVNASPTPTSNITVDRLVGEWLIIDISFVYSQGKMNQVIKAVKRELSLNESEIKLTPPPSSKKEDGEVNDNPVSSSDVPSTNTVDPTSGTASTETPPVIDTQHKLDLIPGSYVDNSGNKIQLCAIDGKPINVNIADAYLNMKEAAARDGIKLKASSGFRSPYDPINATSEAGVKVSASSQKQLYDAYLAGTGNLAAAPGSSNHGNGIGMDLNTGSRKAKSNGPLDSKVYVWLVENSWRYGFVRAVASEEWHYDYLPSLAKSGPYGKLNVAANKRNDTRFYSDLGLDKLDDITKTA